MTSEVRRLIAIFDRASEELVGEFTLDEAAFDFLRRQCGVPSSDPMSDCYPLDTDLVQTLHDMVGLPMAEACDYFLEAEALN